MKILPICETYIKMEIIFPGYIRDVSYKLKLCSNPCENDNK